MASGSGVWSCIFSVNPVMASEKATNNDSGPEELEWRVHPLVENVWKSVLLVVIIITVSILAYQGTGWPGMGVIAILLLTVSMAPYIMPTSYRMDADGIEITFVGVKRFREWAEFRNYLPHHDGVHLSTFRKPNAMEAFRGSYIRFDPCNRDEVLEFLEKHIKGRQETGEVSKGNGVEREEGAKE